MRWKKTLAVLIGAALLLCGRMAQATDTRHGSAGQPIQSILVLGDSLSAEYGLPRGSGWVSIMEKRLANREQAYQIRNASISGDTTISGLQRLPAILEEFDPDLVILQLGANDGLRGQPVQNMKDNLQKMIGLAHDQGARVLLLGQHIPPNYGQRYTRSFHESYAQLAHSNNVVLVPFMLEGIATDPNMFQADGLHPTAEAQTHITDTIWPILEPLLD